jgi:hypothetical protein
MSQHDRRISRLARGLAELIAEYNDMQHRLIERRLDPEEYVFPCNRVPSDFAEFLARTAGPLQHEPAAADRGQ